MRTLAALVLVGATLPAQSPRDLTGYLPAGTPVVVDLCDGAACVERVLRLVEPLPKGLPAAGRVFLMGLPVLTRAATGLGLEDLLDVLAPGQVVFALFPKSAGKPIPVLLSRVTEPREVRRVLARVGRERQLHTDLTGGVLTVSNSAANLEEVLRFRASGAPTLLGDKGYRRNRIALEAGRSIRLYVNVDVLRGRYAKDKSYWERLDAGARFLLGPLVRTFDLAHRLDGRLDIGANGLTLHGRIDADLARDPLRVERLSATGGKPRRMPEPPSSTLACVSLDRNVGALLAEPDRWLGDDGALGVKRFLSTADQILGGASLVKDLLPNVEMPLNLLVTESTPDADADAPRIRLPAFTLVFGLGEDARRVERLLRRSLGTITAIANVQRIQAKKTPISVRGGRRDGYRFQRVRFGDWNGPGDPPTEQGSSPTLLFAHGYGIFSSTIDGAIRMAESLKLGKTLQVTGDYIALRGAAIASVLHDNAALLALSRVLDEGETRRQARQFVQVVESVVGLLRFEGEVGPRAGVTRFTFGLKRNDDRAQRGKGSAK